MEVTPPTVARKAARRHAPKQAAFAVVEERVVLAVDKLINRSNWILLVNKKESGRTVKMTKG